MADEPKIYGNRWRVVRPLGQGGQGRVYEVEDTGQQSAPSEDVLEERMKKTLREATAARAVPRRPIATIPAATMRSELASLRDRRRASRLPSLC